MGQMEIAHRAKNNPWANVPFDQRTKGDCLEEFFFEVAAELEGLEGRDDLTADEHARRASLKDILEGNIEARDRHAVHGLDEEESEEVWGTAHKTGDPLADYWEEQIARGEDPDFDLTEVPENAR